MSPFDWVSIIGAAAWVPQIAKAVHRAAVNPSIQLVVSPIPEIGYTASGPILNLTCAIAAWKKDAIIERIEIELTHERGQKTHLVWKTLNETFSQLRTASGETGEVTKRQPAIALRASQSTLIEKFIGFQEKDYEAEMVSRVSALQDMDHHLSKTQTNYQESLVSSKEFAAIVEYYQNRFPWQEGSYTAEVIVYMSGVNKPNSERLFFSLSTREVERLKANTLEAQRILESITRNKPPEERQVNYNWINPHIAQQTKKHSLLERLFS